MTEADIGIKSDLAPSFSLWSPWSNLLMSIGRIVAPWLVLSLGEYFAIWKMWGDVGTDSILQDVELSST